MSQPPAWASRSNRSPRRGVRCCFPSAPPKGQCWLQMLKVDREKLQLQCFSGGHGGFLQNPERREPACSLGPLLKPTALGSAKSRLAGSWFSAWRLLHGLAPWEPRSCRRRWALPQHLTESLRGALKVPSHQGTKRSDSPDPPVLCRRPCSGLLSWLGWNTRVPFPTAAQRPGRNITMVTRVSEGQQLLLEKVIPRFPARGAPRGGRAGVGGSAGRRLSRAPSPRWYPGYQET